MTRTGKEDADSMTALIPDAFSTLDTIAASRRSVRGFRPDPVPDEVLRRVFRLAGRAPSNCNAQPWITHVVSGDALHAMRDELVANAREGRLDSDAGYEENPYVGVYKDRRIGAAVALFESTGVGRHDKEARGRSMMRNFELFDAPHAAFFFMPRAFHLHGAADVGMYVQTLMLAMTAHGLGSCAQGALGQQASFVKRTLGVDPELMLLFGLSFGTPDDDHPSTAARTDRAALDDAVVFHS